MMVLLQDVAFVMILVFAFIISCFILKFYPAYVVCCFALPSCYLDVHTSSASPSFAFLSFLCQLFQPITQFPVLLCFSIYFPHLYCSLCVSVLGSSPFHKVQQHYYILRNQQCYFSTTKLRIFEIPHLAYYSFYGCSSDLFPQRVESSLKVLCSISSEAKRKGVEGGAFIFIGKKSSSIKV